MKLLAAFLTFAILSLVPSDGFEREAHRIRGHMAALFTPFHPDGSLDLGEVRISDILFLKHACSILRQSSNPVCGSSMMEQVEQVRFCAVWPMENWLASSMNYIQGWMTF